MSVFSNACYQAKFEANPNNRYVLLDVDGHKFRLGERISNCAMTSLGWRTFSFDEVKDGLDYTYDRVLVDRKTQREVGLAQVKFSFRPNEIKYHVIATPSEPIDLGSAKSLLESLVWPVNPESFNGCMVRAEYPDGTFGMNEYIVKDGYDPKKWGVGSYRMSRWELATETYILSAIADEGCDVSLFRSFPPDGKGLTCAVNTPRPESAGWQYLWDKPISHGFNLQFLK